MKIAYGVLVAVLAVGPVWAEGKHPEKKPAPAEKKSSSSLKDAKDGANQALDSVDKGVHTGLHAAKDGAEEALDAVDRGVHKVVGSSSTK